MRSGASVRREGIVIYLRFWSFFVGEGTEGGSSFSGRSKLGEDNIERTGGRRA